MSSPSGKPGGSVWAARLWNLFLSLWTIEGEGCINHALFVLYEKLMLVVLVSGVNFGLQYWYSKPVIWQYDSYMLTLWKKSLSWIRFASYIGFVFADTYQMKLNQNRIHRECTLVCYPLTDRWRSSAQLKEPRGDVHMHKEDSCLKYQLVVIVLSMSR